ncbi:MAG: hypothetical protein FWH44_01925 [Methanomassiliicoccaceae archaeon]|nr:hypothetical protein [Methanomassiliicoccaceae archaeon]
MEYRYSNGHKILTYDAGSYFYLIINGRNTDKVKKEPHRTMELNGTVGLMPVHVKIFPSRSRLRPYPKIVTFVDGVEAPVPGWVGKMYQYNGHEIWVSVGIIRGKYLEIDGQTVDRDERLIGRYRDLNGTVDGVPVRVKIISRFGYPPPPPPEIITFIDGVEAEAVMAANSYPYG